MKLMNRKKKKDFHLFPKLSKIIELFSKFLTCVTEIGLLLKHARSKGKIISKPSPLFQTQNGWPMKNWGNKQTSPPVLVQPLCNCVHTPYPWSTSTSLCQMDPLDGPAARTEKNMYETCSMFLTENINLFKNDRNDIY